MATPKLLPGGRRSCAENYARRAWASAHGRRPSTLLHTAGNLLLVLNTPRTFYASYLRRAMQSGDAERMLRALQAGCTEIARYRHELDKLHDAMPLLYPKSA
jgi:hypothetical protein